MEEENGMRVPGERNIRKIEIQAIGVEMRDMKKLGKKGIKKFSGSISGITMRREMSHKGESGSLWDMETDILNN